MEMYKSLKDVMSCWNAGNDLLVCNNWTKISGKSRNLGLRSPYCSAMDTVEKIPFIKVFDECVIFVENMT
jgi:hypothetical protein